MRDDIKRSIDAYASDGVPLGGFLTAVMEHDLFEAFGTADEENARDMFEIVRYVWNEIPGNCHGSRERVRAWLDKYAGVRAGAQGVTLTDPDCTCGHPKSAHIDGLGHCRGWHGPSPACAAFTQRHGVTPDERADLGLGVEG